MLRGKDRVQVAPGQWVGGDIKRWEPAQAKWPNPVAEQARKTFEAVLRRAR